MKYKTVWTSTLHTKTYVLNNSKELRAERFDNNDLLDLADCKHVFELELYSNKGEDPIDLSLLSHIQDLESLELERVSYLNMAALKKLPNLRRLCIEKCKNFDFSDLDGLNQIKFLTLSHIRISSIPDHFGNNQMTALEDLRLTSNRLQHFPKNLNLDFVTSLDIQWNELTDASFLNHYRKLREVNLYNNKIEKLERLSENLLLERLELYDNPITELSPLKSLTKLKELRIPKELETQAQLLKLPFQEEYPRSETHPEELAASSIIRNLEKDKFYSLKLNQHLKHAIYVETRSGDEKIIEMMLSHPNHQIYEYVIQCGLYEIYTEKLRLFSETCLKDTSRLIPALISAFKYYYKNFDHWGRSSDSYSVDRLKQVHIKILKIAIEISGPQCSDLYKLYLDDYQNFSTYHKNAYRMIFDTIKKTKNRNLVNNIIQTIPCEKLILGGNTPYIKKALMAVKSLGDYTHIKKLESTFERENESREDVLKVYNATIARLEKKR